MVEKLVRTSSRSMWRDLFKWEKDVRILVFNVNVHHVVPSAEEVFHDQIDKLINSVDSFFP